MDGIQDWANLLVRWFHVIAGIAWIGSSFYFVWLDSNLEAPSEGDAADAEEQLDSTAADGRALVSAHIRDSLQHKPHKGKYIIRKH